MTPADSFANDNTLRRRVGSLAPVSRFTFCRRSSRLPYRTVVCLPLSPRVGGSPENRRFSKGTPSISFTPLLFFPPLLLFSFFLVSSRVYYVLSSDRMMNVAKSNLSETNVSFPKRFFFFFFFTKYSSPCLDTDSRRSPVRAL